MYYENVPIIILTISVVVTYLMLYVSNTILNGSTYAMFISQLMHL